MVLGIRKELVEETSVKGPLCNLFTPVGKTNTNEKTPRSLSMTPSFTRRPIGMGSGDREFTNGGVLEKTPALGLPPGGRQTVTQRSGSPPV